MVDHVYTKKGHVGIVEKRKQAEYWYVVRLCHYRI